MRCKEFETVSRQCVRHAGLHIKTPDQSLTRVIGHHSRGIESVRYGESSGSTSGSALVAQGSKDRGRMCRVEDVGLQELASQSEGTEIHISSDDARDPLGLSVVGVKHSDRLGRCRLRLGRDASLVANDKPVASMAQGDKLQPKKAVEWTRRGDLTMWFKEEFDMINAQTAREKDEWADELMSKVVATPQSSVSRDRFRTIDVQDSTKSTGTA